MRGLRSFEFRVPSFEFAPETRNLKPETLHRHEARGNRQQFNFSFSRLTPRASRLLLLLLALTTLGAAPVEKKLKAPKIAVSTHLDKTAVWVGDMFHYTVRAIHDPNIEIVLEPLKKESLNLAPFVVREVTVRHSAFGGDKKVTEVILLLATYESGQAELRIPSFVLYYFTLKAGSEKGGDTLAESFPVPATRVGLRSTLTADALRPRDSRVISRAGPERWMAALALGLAGMIFLAVQFTRLLWTSSSTEKPKTRHLSRRAKARMLQDFLRATQKMGRDSAEDQLRFYGEVSRFVREYLGQSLEIDVSSLTPDEVASALKSHGQDGLGAPVKILLERCEQVLYTRRGADLGRDWRDEVQGELGKLSQRLRM